MAPLQRIPINKNWSFRQTSHLPSSNEPIASTYIPVSQFPTVAHLDLLHHNLIKDPYIDTNELDSLWVNDADFSYRTSLPPLGKVGQDEKEKAVLVFEGLDTVCDVYVSGEKVLEARNMHLCWRVDVTSLLSKLLEKGEELEGEGDGRVELRLEFSNAPAYAKKEMKRIGYKGNGTDVHFGGPERLFVRKAQ